MKCFPWVCTLLFSAAVLSAQEPPPPPTEEIPVSTEEEAPSKKLEDNPNTQLVIQDGIDFAFDLFRTMQKGGGEN